MAVSTAGRLYSTGCSQFGQLGNGETGEYFITANKLAFSNCAVWTVRDTFCGGDEKVAPLPDSGSILVRHVACGKHHTVVVEAPAENGKARVFSFGCGDYGCLGHGVQKVRVLYWPWYNQVPFIRISRLTFSFLAITGRILPPSNCRLAECALG